MWHSSRLLSEKGGFEWKWTLNEGFQFDWRTELFMSHFIHEPQHHNDYWDQINSDVHAHHKSVNSVIIILVAVTYHAVCHLPLKSIQI